MEENSTGTDNNSGDPPWNPTLSPPTQEVGTALPNIFENIVILNDQRKDMADLFKALTLEKLWPELFQKEITDSIQIEDFIHPKVHHNADLIRRIRQTLVDVGRD